VKRLQSINNKWWWHELALIAEIGLEDSENATGGQRSSYRILLTEVVFLARKDGGDKFHCEEQKHGGMETFTSATGEGGLRTKVSTRPRYYRLLSNKQDSNCRIPSIQMKEQNLLLSYIQGTGGARIKDPDVI
jgi:hypothetical protein